MHQRLDRYAATLHCLFVCLFVFLFVFFVFLFVCCCFYLFIIYLFINHSLTCSPYTTGGKLHRQHVDTHTKNLQFFPLLFHLYDCRKKFGGSLHALNSFLHNGA